MTDHSKPWLFVVGIGEDGTSGLSDEGRAVIGTAEILIGGQRHLDMIPDAMSNGAKRSTWPSPFSSTFSHLESLRGQRVVILASGDPMNCGIGGTLSRFFDWHDLHIVPNVSAYSLAAACLGWPLDKTHCLTIHGRNPAGLLPYFFPGQKLLILSKDHTSPLLVANQLVAAGAGHADIHILENLGGNNEHIQTHIAADLVALDEEVSFSRLNTIAVEIPADFASWLSWQAGLPDDAYQHDGKLTKRDIRASALAKLAPRPNALLWDVGTGCGSIAIEWLRSHPSCQAIGIDPQEKRRAFAQANAHALGVPRLKLVDANAPEGLKELDRPDAIFVGGGLSTETLSCCLEELKPGGRLVAHAVTLGSQSLLTEFYDQQGGELIRLLVEKAVPVGPLKGWKPSMPVVQWVYIKEASKKEKLS